MGCSLMMSRSVARLSILSAVALLSILVCIRVWRTVDLSPTGNQHEKRQKQIETETNRQQFYQCAPWIKKRTVLFYQVFTMEKFNTPGLSKSGEEYVFAALDWALRQNGFAVEWTDKSLDDWTVKQLAPYHRIFFNGVHYYRPFYNHSELVCRARPLAFFTNTRPPEEAPYDPRQIMSPYPDDINTFMGYFVHSMLSGNPPPPAHRFKEGLLIGKVAALFKPEHHPIIEALMADGFVLYSVCHEDLEHHCGLPEGVIIKPSMSPVEYEAFISDMAFLMGFGNPVISPSPLVGLAHGAAWLNPIVGTRDQINTSTHLLQDYRRHAPGTFESILHFKHPSHIETQHTPLALLGMPYVYNIDLENVTQVVEAANHAVKYRFSSFVPPEFRPEAMIARACALMEDDQICQCPNPIFGFGGESSSSSGKSSSDVDCHGSTYVRSVPLGYR